MPNEADTCRRYVVPKLQAAGWEDEPHRLNEQVYFTDGRIQSKVDAIKKLQEQTAAELDAMLPSILDRAFKGQL